ncbi:MAG: hypothetical protein M3317_07315 [Actinomycetota bacterium]|nr:hypothetical protein [Actinomycetota bacterium]
MNVTLRRALLVCVLALVLAAMAAGAASAQTPITVSQHSHKTTESFTGYVNCQGTKLYDITYTFNELVRFTAAGEDEEGNPLPPLHFHHTFVGWFVAVPVDGTGPTFTGHETSNEMLNAKSFEEFVGTYSDQHRIIARGSDGSKINFHLHVRFSVNAKGEVTVDFVRVRPDASCIMPGE